MPIKVDISDIALKGTALYTRSCDGSRGLTAGVENCASGSHPSAYSPGGGAWCEFISPSTTMSSVFIPTSHLLVSSVQTLASTIVGETFPLLFLQNMIFLKNPILMCERKEHLPRQMASAVNDMPEVNVTRTAQ